MRLMHKNRRLLSFISLLVFVFGMGASSASAYYNPNTGRFISVDLNQQAIVLHNIMLRNAQTAAIFASFNAHGQYTDGMNFYEYLKSNVINGTDPSGLAAFNSVELLGTQGTRSYLRTGLWFAVGGMAYTGLIGANQAAIKARHSGAGARHSSSCNPRFK